MTALLFLLHDYSNGQKVSTSSLSNSVPRTTGVELDDYFRKAAGLGFSGAVLVARGGDILLRNGYGWADIKRRIPITADTVFDVGSNTKVFTAVAIMQLEERGRLSTSDSIGKYFQNVPEDKKAITIHQLLTHTAGYCGSAKKDIVALKEILPADSSPDSVMKRWDDFVG